MLAGYFHLLFLYIAANIYNLHAVEQGLRYGRKRVGSGNEEHIRQVVIDVDIIVVEVRVLFRVEHFEQSRSRVALEVVAYLVDFVEHKHRVGALAANESLNYAARHSAYVGAAVTSYFSLVVQTAERYARIFAIESIGNRASE